MTNAMIWAKLNAAKTADERKIRVRQINAFFEWAHEVKVPSSHPAWGKAHDALEDEAYGW